MKRKEPKLKPYLDIGDVSLFQEEVVSDVDFSHLILPKNYEVIEFNGCRFVHVNFSNIATSISFYDCVFESCDFSNMIFDGGCFTRAKFSQCKLLGSRIINASIQEVTFSSCNLDYMSILESSLSHVSFTSSTMVEVRNFKLKLKEISFLDCQIIRLENISTSLKEIDFSASTLEGGTFSLSDLQGVTLNREQALNITKLFGIKITDE